VYIDSVIKEIPLKVRTCTCNCHTQDNQSSGTGKNRQTLPCTLCKLVGLVPWWVAVQLWVWSANRHISVCYYSIARKLKCLKTFNGVMDY